MAIRYTDIRPEPEKPANKRPAEKIMEGLKEAISIAKGEAEPARWHFGTRAPNGSFDKKAYMREYMRAKRSKKEP